ncbi:protein YIF1B-B-like [Amphiura filiformis]|uniref:protein YIF1B-B-like n=1 Tax=Amphiura filiformis TaxID=82378 RepID=UPI003B222797
MYSTSSMILVHHTSETTSLEPQVLIPIVPDLYGCAVGYRNRKSHKQQGHQRKTQKSRGQEGPTPLFDDTSTGPPPPQGGYGAPPPNDGGVQQFPGQQYLNDPMANMAMQYGANLADQGKDVMEKQIDRFMSVSKLKYYFAVDTTYVAKKLAIVLCPFTHTEWSIRYNQQDEPIAPRYEINAPDLYIPVMGFVTYLLLAGVALGKVDRFTPEELGIQASSALVWLVIEILAVVLTLYVMNIQSTLRTLDLIAFSGYKYVGMIVCLLAQILVGNMGYWVALLYTSAAIVFFLGRNLKLIILPESHPDHIGHGNKRRMYLLLFIAALQPIFIFWLTRHLSTAVPPKVTKDW